MLKEKLNEDLKKYLKEKNSLALNAVRSIIAEIKNKEVEKGSELTEEEIIQVIKKQIKMREDSIEQYQKAQRNDLVQKEEQEIEVIKTYLPQELSEEELEKIVREAIEDVHGESIKDLGKVMKSAIKKAQGRADSKKINQIATKLLK
ncbi:GatB/YqeY domain-containing protein [Petrotoga sp. 9PWA.NaAc.5.4]|uniref:GatB/YqeY domain-containing protein n=1 Tax=Petrotoga sp. 9PWA.NaAc.5.4 TaxID=1434328 RepID=UPI000CC960D1|nr:GatB/YqeY domain-containing protein [Petrotoga sp. 9PWA.NaAc.5.4]PNR96666.1 aspartyl-tRNA amidotransferase subunit B [Petrotoga sp. 9PWA.NaAc.5.4]